MGGRAFKAHNGHWLASNEGGVHLHHDKNHHAHFHIEDHGNGKVTIRNHHGHYLAVDHKHHVHVVHNHHSEDAKFHVEHHHGKVAFKTHHGRYLSARDGHVTTHHERGEHELWEEHHV